MEKNDNMSTILFLTACVNPKGMAYTKLNNPEVRLQQYKEALNWYLENTDLKILLVENSGCDFSDCYQRQMTDGRLEFLCFEGNDYDRSRGKGYGEAAIMEYGITHSRLISSAPSECLQIIKVTGRLICQNVKELCERYHNIDTVYSDIGKDDWNGNIANSQFVLAPISFWKDYFLPNRENIDDSARCHFEHLLYDSIGDWKKTGKRHREFWLLPKIIGVSGTNGQGIMSSAHRDVRDKIMYFLHWLGYRGYLNPLYKGDENYEINKE